MRLAMLAALAACGASGAAARGPANAQLAGDDVTLYRDVAQVSQRVALVIGASGRARVRVAIAAGVAAQRIVVEASDGVVVRRFEADAADRAAGVVHAEVTGTPGRHAFVLGYLTDRIHWEAAYTLATDSARERATLGGAIAIRNDAGLVVDARVRVVDGPRAAGARGARELGEHVLAPGETRIALVADRAPQPLRRVLVYDPIGTKWDNPSGLPLRSAIGGAPSSTAVTESFELARDPRATAALPAGPVRLVETQADGTLALVGEAPLTDGAQTIPIGVAVGVTATRARRELTIDDARRRIVEEIELSVANRRAVPVEMVLREHMYRGLTWTLVYDSTRSAVKEGPQQIALRVQVPAHGQLRVLYVVRYWWEP